MTDNLNHVFFHPDLDGLALIVPLVINRIAQGFFNGCIWIIEKAIGLCLIRMLDHFFRNNIILDVSEGRSQLILQRSLKCLLVDLIAALALRKLYDIDLRIRKKTYLVPD